jgi:glycosyltransferase involved in cell wall biosynthesis
LGRPDKFVVLGAGSSGGVVVSRFEGTPEQLVRAVCIRAGLGIPEKSPVVGFVGRIVRDKGVVELVSAFEEVSRRIPGMHLIIVGQNEEGDPIPAKTRAEIERNIRIHAVGQVRDTAAYLHAMDVLVLPTYREGFPNVVLEAGAAGKPVVATRATGVVDAVVDGVTGLLSEIGDVEGLAANIARVLEDKDLARRLGQAGRERAEREFQPERIYRELEQLYIELLREKGMEVEVGPEGVRVREVRKRRWWRRALGAG